MKSFFKYIICFSILPAIVLLLIIAGYFIFDPFKVLKPYPDYSHPLVGLNRDYISTETFIRKRKTINYNSFIFGNSLTVAYKPDSWKKHLSPTAVPFCFDASNESIYGIYKKIKYLEKIHQKMDNALLIFSSDPTFAKFKNQKGHLFIKDPAVSGESKWVFQKEFFDAYFSSKFIRSFYTYQLLKQFKPWMKGTLIDYDLKYDAVNNYETLIDQENELANNRQAYYEKRKNVFYERKGETTDSVIRYKSKQIEMLTEIKKIFDKNNTQFRIIISPLYNQVKLSPSDFNTLKTIFGDNVYDFSGKNSITESKYNYYEQSHYTTAVGDSIMNIIYQPK